MGKPKNKKRKNEDGHHGSHKNNRNKRPKGMPPKGKKEYRKMTRYWVETCNDSKPRPQAGGTSDMKVLITRVELMDDHTHGPNQTKVQPNLPTEEKSSSAEVTAKPENAPTNDDEQTKNQSEQKDDNSPSDAKETKVIPNSAKDAGAVSEDKESNDSKETADYTNAFISVRRTSSAKGKPKKYPLQYYKPLPNGDCGDGIVNPYPDKVDDKFWAQRRRLFSRFDEGIQLDAEGWFSVTPESIAIHIAERLAQQVGVTKKDDKMVVLDAFCGCGGNAIAFGKRPDVSLVICVDTDRAKLRLAAQNASIYGVPSDKLLFLEADACHVMAAYRNGKRNSLTTANASDVEHCHGYQVGGVDLLPEQIHAIFLSPPWGGTDYEKIGPRNYDLATSIKIDSNKEEGDYEQSNGEDLLVMAASALENPVIGYFLPRNTNGVSVGRSALKAGIRGEIEMEQNILNGKFKTITTYFAANSNGIES